MSSIKLKEGKAEFEVFISAWTAGKMDKAQRLLAGQKATKDAPAVPGYTAPEHRVNDIINAFEVAPEICKEDEGLKSLLPVLLKMEAGEITREATAAKLSAVLSTSMTLDDEIHNGRILRELVRLMCLESDLTNSQTKLIKSDIDSEFWQNQDAELLRDTGENFRAYVMAYTKRGR